MAFGRRPPRPPENETDEERDARYASVGMKRLVRRDPGEGYLRIDGTFVPATKPPPSKGEGGDAPDPPRRT